MYKLNYNFNEFDFIEVYFPILLFLAVLGIITSNSMVEWKDSISEGQYFDIDVKTQSKIVPEKQNFLNYTIQLGYNQTNGINVKYYPILEVENNVKRITDQQTTLLNGNITSQFGITLEKGINKWSLVIELLNSDIPPIVHHGVFDEIYRDNHN